MIRTCDNGHPPARVLSGAPCRECERRRPSRQARGYDAAHQRARALLLTLLPVPCAYGCGAVIVAASDLVAAHVVDGDASAGWQASCRSCNERAKRMGWGGIEEVSAGARTVARSAVENAERLVADREAGKVDAAVKCLTTCRPRRWTAARASTPTSSRSCAASRSRPTRATRSGRRGPRLAEPAGERARPAAARGRGVPDQRDPRLRRHARPDRRARRRDLAARPEDREVGRLAGRPGVRRPPAPAGGLRQRRVHRPDRRPGAAPAAGGHPVRHRPRRPTAAPGCTRPTSPSATGSPFAPA